MIATVTMFEPALPPPMKVSRTRNTAAAKIDRMTTLRKVGLIGAPDASVPATTLPPSRLAS
jgi:hypothetical protein